MLSISLRLVPVISNNICLSMLKQEVNELKNYRIQCPYCGANAVLKSANKLFGAKVHDPDRFLYVCSNWPACDSYVTAHAADRSPMGTLANRQLRHKRIQAHKALLAYRKATRTEKWASYIWLEGKLGLDQKKTHIGMFSDAECDQVIALCRKEATRFNRSRMRGVSG